MTGRIEINPEVMLGKPVIRGTRIPVELLLRKLAEGATMEDLMDAYPRLTIEDIRAALAYAADSVATRPSWHPYLSRPSMRFLADESCDFAVVRALRRDGHDVLAVSESQQRSVDQEVLELALRENRVLLTEDKDFGRLVFAARAGSPGVILIRFPASARGMLTAAIRRLVAERGSQLEKAFVVLQPGSMRISASPRDAG